MKNLKNITLALLSFLAITSCSDFLKEDPKSLISTDNFYKTNNDVVAATNAIYLAMRDDVTGGIAPIWMAESASDDGKAGGTPVGERLEVDNLIYASRHGFIRTVWNTAYKAIDRANAVLYYVDTIANPKLNPTIVKRSYAEARFLRAFYYTRLVQMYGDVPLVLKPTTDETLYPSRTPKADVYKQIIEDLQYAETELTNNYTYTDANGGRATKVAAKALLGYVYLVMAGFPMNDKSKWQAAADKFNEIIANKAQYGVDLMTVYKDIFDPTKKSLNKEYIFYYKGTTGQSASLLAYTRLQYWYFGFTSIVPTKEATDSVYEANDARKFVSLGRKSGSSIVPITQTGGTVIINKYVDNLANSNDNANDFHALRYGDVVLMNAEALIEIGGTANLDKALTAINDVRKAHGGAAMTALTYTSQDDLRQKLRLERRRELMFEGKRWYDLVRWNVFVPVMQKHMSAEYLKPISDYNYINTDRMLMPLPYIDFINNPNLRPQNPGY